MLVDYRDSKAKQATFCQGHAMASKMCSFDELEKACSIFDAKILLCILL